MNLKIRIATALFAGALIVPALSVAEAGYSNGDGAGALQYGYGQQPGPGGGWDAPPAGFRQDVQRRGWRDGMEGARKDLENRRTPNVMNRDEFRDYRGPGRRAYRAAFQSGYNAFWSHQGGRGRYR